MNNIVNVPPFLMAHKELYQDFREETVGGLSFLQCVKQESGGARMLGWNPRESA